MENSLRDYRERHGLSQGALAEHVGVTRQTINAVERDRYDPSVELVFALAAFFECPVEELFHPDVDLDETASDLDA
ncbi:helix-turn-helix transcriptional regulator [Halarchaeum sp. P4]|uniref:helix-turn-helix transcriptional regulator n=1 Tax=Halarchaeum sp. P4 TaxID=3421639 RepID=UPI003EC0B0E9